MNQSRDARLAMRRRIESDDAIPFIVFGLSIFIFVGMIFSEDFREIIHDAHVFWQYAILIIFVGLNVLFVNLWRSNRREKRSAALHHEKEIERMAEAEARSK